MCTALNKKGFSTPYKSTHIKHPCVLWTEASYSNFLWLRDLALALNAEYRFRFDKNTDHSSIAVLKEISDLRFDDVGLTEFAQAMPNQYKIQGNAVLAYRQYYIGEKLRFAKWTKRARPFGIPVKDHSEESQVL